MRGRTGKPVTHTFASVIPAGAATPPTSMLTATGGSPHDLIRKALRPGKAEHDTIVMRSEAQAHRSQSNQNWSLAKRSIPFEHNQSANRLRTGLMGERERFRRFTITLRHISGHTGKLENMKHTDSKMSGRSNTSYDIAWPANGLRRVENV